MEKYKRQLKVIDKKFKLTYTSISLIIFAVSLTVFLVGQVMINNKLSPLGVELQVLNNEKNALIDENRSIEQTLAGIKSLTALEYATSKNNKLRQVEAKQIVYLIDSNTQASR